MAMSDCKYFQEFRQTRPAGCCSVVPDGAQQPSEITSCRTLQTFLKEQAYQHVPERARQAPFE